QRMTTAGWRRLECSDDGQVAAKGVPGTAENPRLWRRYQHARRIQTVPIRSSIPATPIQVPCCEDWAHERWRAATSVPYLLDMDFAVRCSSDPCGQDIHRPTASRLPTASRPRSI